MVKVIVCIGSSCHLKGSRQIVEQLQQLIEENKVGDQVELAGAFCMGKCAQDDGVSVTVDDECIALKSENVVDFFNEKVMSKLSKN